MSDVEAYAKLVSSAPDEPCICCDASSPVLSLGCEDVALCMPCYSDEHLCDTGEPVPGHKLTPCPSEV